MATKRIKKYRMIPIPAKFSEKGGCTAQFVAGEYSVDAESEILPGVIEANGVKISKGTAWDLVNSFIKACAARAANTGETVTVGSLMSFGLSIRGWYERTDSKASRDNVRVTATLLGDLRPTIEFGMSNALDGVKLKLSTIRGEGLPFDHVQGGQPFRINGVGLNLIDGDTVVAKAVTPDGDVVEAACSVTSTEDDRLDAILPAAFGASALVGREVSITVTSHCGDPTATPDIRAITATLDASAEPAPEPTPTGPTVAAINDGTFHSGGGNVVTGANMRFADALPGDHVVIKDGEGHDMEAMISTDDEVPVTEARFGLNIDEGTPLTDGAEYTFEFSMLDAEGQPVTVTKTARWQAN